jgi:hypothetical protein
MTEPDDEKLRRGFAKLRERDARHAPAFDDLVRAGRPRRAPRWGAIVAIGAPAIGAAAVLLLWCGTMESRQTATASAPAPAASAAVAATAMLDAPVAGPPDPAPLDFLLELPASSVTSLLPGTSR